MTFLVWNPTDSDESRARRIEADFADEAAQDFAATCDSSTWPDTSRVYHVRDEERRLFEVRVRLSMEPVFRAGEPRRIG